MRLAYPDQRVAQPRSKRHAPTVCPERELETTFTDVHLPRGADEAIQRVCEAGIGGVYRERLGSPADAPGSGPAVVIASKPATTSRSSEVIAFCRARR